MIEADEPALVLRPAVRGLVQGTLMASALWALIAAVVAVMMLTA